MCPGVCQSNVPMAVSQGLRFCELLCQPVTAAVTALKFLLLLLLLWKMLQSTRVDGLDSLSLSLFLNWSFLPVDS